MVNAMGQSHYSDAKLLEIARIAAGVEVDAVAQVLDQIGESFVEVVRMVRATAGKVLVTGSGTSSHVARRMAHLLAVSGTPALFIHPMDALHGTMGAIQPNDLLIALSKTGESEEVVTLCSLVRKRGSVVVGMGEAPESSLAHVSDVFVTLVTAGGADAGGTIAFGSTLVAALWGDALVRTLMVLNGWELSDTLAIHPAGGVGKMIGAANGAVGTKGV